MDSSEILAYKTGELPPSREERQQQPQADNDRRQFLEQVRARRETMGEEDAAAVEVFRSHCRLQFGVNVSPRSTDVQDQGECSACSAFSVAAAMESCVSRVAASPEFGDLPPRALSAQQLLDCGGEAGCDGGQVMLAKSR